MHFKFGFCFFYASKFFIHALFITKLLNYNFQILTFYIKKRIFKLQNENVFIPYKIGEITMIMQQVHSSKIKSIGFNSSAMILRVEFIKDGLYEYYGVPERIVNEFLDAPSQGIYFKRFIKDNYRFVRIS